jgi:hypothetical protein
VIVGLFGIWKISKNSNAVEDKNILMMVKQLTRKFNIKRSVQVNTSLFCRVPFTFGTAHPVVLLPNSAKQWPHDRLRAVLTHELAHVKRFDCTTQLLARIICSVFWFMPVVWVAYSQLQSEQEKSCDEYVVGSGVKAVTYARHVLSVVQSVKKRVLLTGIFISKGKRNVLERRILHLLKLGNIHASNHNGIVVGIVIVCCMLIAQIFIFNVGFSEEGKYVPSDREELFGAWVNDSYDWTESINPAKLLYKPDGTFECFDETDGDTKNWWGSYTIHDKWMDKEGNIWYKITFADYMAGTLHYELVRLSSSGTVFESCYFNVDYPSEIDPDSLRYSYKLYMKP